MPHNSSLRHELNLPPSCTTLPRPQAETVLCSPGLGSRGTKDVARVSPPLVCDTAGVRVGLGRNRQRKVFSGEGLWPGRSQPTCGLSLLLHWLLVSFPLWQCVQMPVFEGSFWRFLRGTSTSEELTVSPPFPPPPCSPHVGQRPCWPWRSSLPARRRMPLMYDNTNRACST